MIEKKRIKRETNNLSFFIAFSFVIAACNSSTKRTYVSESNGNINSLTVVMQEQLWEGKLGDQVRSVFKAPYEGLPFDEPKYDTYYIPPKAFSGFARNSRNVIIFSKDTINKINLLENPWAKPQVVALISGEDQEVMGFYLDENKDLILRTFAENERKEKIRRISKSLNKEKELVNRFGLTLKYPSAYTTVKDTANFLWIEKQVYKGHLNLIVYSLPPDTDLKIIEKRIPEIRDSIGKIYIPGRLPKSYMITEKAYRPYYYRTKLNGLETILTKGTWEVENDYMAGPFINYVVKDTQNKRYIVLEGFAFAPTESKRNYMFELNSIITTLKPTK
ncbi:uncharacterized protein METZ01_LOCUS27358 [marine metagenome]|uniref:DUF4837 domain-containing protein n=1 Tax=marine metagenome TaxID=408172 RepID=A0A381Q6K7_9ZZZZ